MISVIKNSVYVFSCFVLLVSCSNKNSSNIIIHKIKKEPAHQEYKHILSIDKNMDMILDSLVNVKVFEDEFMILNYCGDSNWTVSIYQNNAEHKLYDRSNLRNADYLIRYKTTHIYANPLDSNIFNKFFKIDKDMIVIFDTIGTDPNIYYFSEQYKENKELVPAFCSYQFRIVDDKIVNFNSNCDSMRFKTKKELENPYKE
jgi:hypothetical protein